MKTDDFELPAFPPEPGTKAYMDQAHISQDEKGWRKAVIEDFKETRGLIKLNAGALIFLFLTQLGVFAAMGLFLWRQ